MSQHYTKNTLFAPKWCNECKKQTSHRVFGGRISNVCIPCQEKAEAEHQARLASGKTEEPAAVQEVLFA